MYFYLYIDYLYLYHHRYQCILSPSMMFAPSSEVNRSNVRKWIPDAPEEIGCGWWLGFKREPWENHRKSIRKWCLDQQTWGFHMNSWILIWLVVYLPLWKMMEFVSWDDEIPNWMESHKKIPWFQSTNQIGKWWFFTEKHGDWTEWNDDLW